jgi:Holliday junction resolvase RusA-like endonuclease
MAKISFVVHGDPVPKARARVVQNKKTGRMYAFTPKKTLEYEELIRGVASSFRPVELMEGPIVLGLRVYRRIPKSFSKKKSLAAEAGQIRPDTRPDMDNYLKAVKDALQGVIWKNDSQIVEYDNMGKYYSFDPRAEIEVREWEFQES